MPKTNVEALREAVFADPGLQKLLSSAAANDFFRLTVQVAAERGIEISEDDLRAELAARKLAWIEREV